jgi:hypothetical protein
MRGGCQSHLMRCSDGHYYVVKFPNNPQGRRVLANELLCTSLAELLSLPVAHGAVVFVSEELVRLSDDLCIQQGLGRTPCESGWCFGSRHVGGLHGKAVYDFLPSSMLTQVSNLRDFCGMLVFDIWTSNDDSRQVVFAPNELNSYRAVMIDHGFCFDGRAWQITESHRRSLYLDTRVYKDVRGIEAFESWLTALAGINKDLLNQSANGIPPQWFGGDRTGLARLLDQLYERKDQIRGKIEFFGGAFPAVFPNWKGRAVCAGSAA